MTFSITMIIFVVILPKEFQFIKLNSFIKSNIDTRFLEETVFPLLEPSNSAMISASMNSYELFDVILEKCRDQNKAVSIHTNPVSFPNDVTCFIALDMNEIDVCNIFLKLNTEYSEQYLTVILVNLKFKPNVAKVESCFAALHHVQVLYISLKSEKVVFKSPHFAAPFSCAPQKHSCKTNNKLQNISDKLINVATFHYPPFSIIKETKHSVEYDGMEMNLFREMSTYLNFTWRLVDLPNPGGWGKRLSNGTMVGGIFQPLQEGGADVAFCNIWQRDTTLDIIDFGPPLNKIYVTFIVRRPYQLSDRWQSLIGIFKNDVWLFTCIVFAIVSLVFWTGRSLAPYTESRPSLIESALIMFGMLMVSTSYQHASTFHLRLVVICWLVFTLLFTTALTSSIVTRLTVPLYSPRVDSVQQLVEGGYYWTQPVYLQCRATLSEFYFNLDNTWHHQFESKYKYIKLEDIDEHLNSDDKIALVAQRWGDWVMFEMEGFDETRDLAEFRLMRGSMREAYTSFAFRKHFPFNQLFTRTIQLFIDHGLWAYWVHKLTQEDSKRKQLLVEKDVTEFNQPEQLTLTKLCPVFYLHMIGLSLSFLVFLIELCYRYS